MWRTIWRWIKVWVLVLMGVFIGWLCYEFITFPSISRLRDQNPATTAMIDTRAQEAIARGEQPRQIQTWVPLEKISPNLQRAVLAGEDTNFSTHHGFDYDAIQRAWDEGSKVRSEEHTSELQSH